MATYEEALLSLCEKDDRVVVMTAENRSAIRGLPPKIGRRFIDVGICEQTMIGMAAGLALCGRVPICHALAAFLTLRAYEFIRTDLGIGSLPAVLVGAVPGLLSEANGPTHQAIEDTAILRAIPGMRIVWPADREELCAAMPVLVDEQGPSYVRYCAPEPKVAHRPFELGVAEELKSGDEVAILACGFLLHQALDAAARLAERGRSVRLVNLRTLAPIDERAILRAARECRLVVTVEDHLLAGGLYTLCSEIFAKQRVAARLLPIALERRWFEPIMLPGLLDHEGFSGEKLATRIDRALLER